MSMPAENIVPLTTDVGRLDQLKVKILTARERIENDEGAWVEGTLELAALMLEASNLCKTQFKYWLKRVGLTHWCEPDLHGLMWIARKPDIGREVLTEAPYRSYQRIWKEYKHRFRGQSKSVLAPVTRNRTRAMHHRQMKLGKEVIESLKGTSLESVAELDQLIMLNRGAPRGELLPNVKKLIEEAKAGNHVSAVSESNRLNVTGKIKHLPKLQDFWRKHATAVWQRASSEERIQFVEYLTELVTRPK